MADLLLTNAMNATEALFEAIWIPRQVVVHHEVGVLKVDAFTGSIRGDEDPDFGVRAEECPGLPAVVTVDTTVNDDDGVVAAEHTGNFFVQVIQGVAVFAEDDDFAHPPARIVHWGSFWRMRDSSSHLRSLPEATRALACCSRT